VGFDDRNPHTYPQNSAWDGEEGYVEASLLFAIAAIHGHGEKVALWLIQEFDEFKIPPLINCAYRCSSSMRLSALEFYDKHGYFDELAKKKKEGESIFSFAQPSLQSDLKYFFVEPVFDVNGEIFRFIDRKYPIWEHEISVGDENTVKEKQRHVCLRISQNQFDIANLLIDKWKLDIRQLASRLYYEIFQLKALAPLLHPRYDQKKPCPRLEMIRRLAAEGYYPSSSLLVDNLKWNKRFRLSRSWADILEQLFEYGVEIAPESLAYIVQYYPNPLRVKSLLQTYLKNHASNAYTLLPFIFKAMLQRPADEVVVLMDAFKYEKEEATSSKEKNHGEPPVQAAPPPVPMFGQGSLAESNDVPPKSKGIYMNLRYPIGYLGTEILKRLERGESDLASTKILLLHFHQNLSTLGLTDGNHAARLFPAEDLDFLFANKIPVTDFVFSYLPRDIIANMMTKLNSIGSMGATLPTVKEFTEELEKKIDALEKGNVTPHNCLSKVLEITYREFRLLFSFNEKGSRGWGKSSDLADAVMAPFLMATLTTFSSKGAHIDRSAMRSLPLSEFFEIKEFFSLALNVGEEEIMKMVELRAKGMEEESEAKEVLQPWQLRMEKEKEKEQIEFARKIEALKLTEEAKKKEEEESPYSAEAEFIALGNFLPPSFSFASSSPSTSFSFSSFSSNSASAASGASSSKSSSSSTDPFVSPPFVFSAHKPYSFAQGFHFSLDSESFSLDSESDTEIAHKEKKERKGEDTSADGFKFDGDFSDSFS